MIDPGQRVPKPLHLEPFGVCILCGDEGFGEYQRSRRH